jgi:hypothetical protein
MSRVRGGGRVASRRSTFNSSSSSRISSIAPAQREASPDRPLSRRAVEDVPRSSVRVGEHAEFVAKHVVPAGAGRPGGP